jgi:CheY-like chemotaxis protein
LEDLVLNPLGPSRECIVLYVEDDDVTGYLFQHALTHTGTHLHLFRVSNGEEALSFLFRQGPYCEAPLPDLVILDINMPKKTDLTFSRASDPIKN